MSSTKKILIAFILNLFFSIFEFIGGIFTGSVAILSDAIHDLGDATSIGFSYFLEKKSKKKPDKHYTYGYARYSVLGGVITTIILLVGSIGVFINAIGKIITPTEINYNGMIIFAIVGVIVNFLAAYFTHDGHSINQKAVNLHMLEDVLGWVVVLIGAVVMKFTNFVLMDPLMSIGVAVFIFINAWKNLKSVLDLFLEKTPKEIDVAELEWHLKEIYGVEDVHHIHLWSFDGQNNYCTLHVVSDCENIHELKHRIREELEEHGVVHTTIELERTTEHCHEKECKAEYKPNHGCCHHHHH